ncbi:DUF5672 family protein [Hymenobacter cavernae]|uniref:DUF5672 domain-containing protein n=1 Tax=Hymenobacter cavernae TaxID=2044852 RepID=A0ABQ1UKW6_9BACT|nr:DUF5672 family protein [Hymenobacter cavernae]GGF20542.1 hypothetical protein GCM10011383_35230 [Hymenobacter cavernae]
MNKVCVVIPVHKPVPSAYELISLQQCFRILGTRPIKIVAPSGLDLANYKAAVADLDVIYIDPKWQSSLLGYNKLKLSKYFYNLFSGYEFLLTYELDAFIFNDSLDYWCAKGYDYIGAPWFEGFDFPTPDAKIIGVGNSGFSLRKISSAKRMLSSIYYEESNAPLYGRRALLKAKLDRAINWLKSKTGENPTVQSSGLYEDIFFSKVAPEFSKKFIVAPVEDAIKFSFEVQPEVLFKVNSNVLPMGCHAWWKYNLDFWRPFIKNFGYKL